MKINKVLLKIFSGCILAAAVFANAPASYASDLVTSTAVDFSDSCWEGFGGSGDFAQADGAVVGISKNDGADIEIKDSENADFVTDLNGAEKYLQYTTEKGKGPNTLTIQPKNALKEDFSFEFKAAGKRVGGSDVRYLTIVMIPEGAADNTHGTTVFGWNNSYMYDTGTSGQSSRWPNNNEIMRIEIPNWGNKYAIGFSGNTLRSYKIDVHFEANSVPTFDLWGYYAANTGLEEDDEGRQLLLKGVKFASRDGNNTSAVDYSKGIGSIRIEMGANENSEGIALADMKISEMGKILLADIYSDNMVITKNKPFVIVGSGLNGGVEVTAQIIDDEENTAAQETVFTDKNGVFNCVFADLSQLLSDKTYKLLLKSGNIERIIQNVALGEVWVFDGSENFSDGAESENNNRLFVAGNGGKGSWKYAKDCAGLDTQAKILDRLSEKSGSVAGGIIGFENVGTYVPDGIICLASANDLKNGISRFDEYINAAKANNIKVLYTIPCDADGMSAEELFNLQCAAVNLEKSNYAVIKGVPVVKADLPNDVVERIVNGIYGEYVSLVDYELSVKGSEVYLFLSDNADGVYGDDFLAEDVSGKVNSAESVEKDGNVIKLTFGTTDDIIKLYYGKSGISRPIYSENRMTVLAPFAIDYDGKEEFDFADDYDRAKFSKLYCSDTADFSDSGLIISDGSVLLRDKLCFAADDVNISMSASGRGEFKLLINGTVLYENEIAGSNVIEIKRNNNVLEINGQIVESDIEAIDTLSISFADVNGLVLSEFKAAMPHYSEVLEVIIGLKNLPDYNNATYNDVADIMAMCDKYDDLGGETNSIFSSELNEKVKKLKEFCEKAETEKQNIGENIKATFSINEADNYKAVIKLNNSSSLVPYSVECLAIVYNAEGALASISSKKITLPPSEEKNIEIIPNSVNAGKGHINYYVLNDVALGYVIADCVNTEF